MKSELKKLPGNTIELIITIPWEKIKQTFDKIHASLLGEIEVTGFRKGKAPKELAEKQIDRNKIYEEVISELIPHAYADAIKEHSLHPIISPRIELVEAAEHKDWKVKAATCEKPEVKLKNYRKTVSDIHASKTTKIWTPGDDKAKQDKKPEVTVGELLEAISKEVDVELSEILLEQEVNRMLSNLVNDVQKLGMTLDQYLQAQGKTHESIRKEYTEQAKKTISMEFALEEIAEAEKMTVEDADIDAFIKEAKTEADRTALEKQRYYIASILRRQKTLSHLLKSPAIATV